MFSHAEVFNYLKRPSPFLNTKNIMKPTTELYHIVEAIVPLYVVMLAAYISFKWLKIFSKEQCSGINKFVAKFSIPLLSFQVISNSNPFKMNLKFIAADSLQKILAFSLLAGVTRVIVSRGRLKWVITGLSLSTLPNTLVLGIPLLRAMYGQEAATLLAQIVVLQSLIWNNFLLFLFELNANKKPNLTPQENQDGLESPQERQRREEAEDRTNRTPTKTKIILINLSKVGRKLIINPNTHATLVGLIWAIIHFRYDIQLTKIVDKSITILSDGGLGMAMFSLGLFMASQASIIPCGSKKAIFAMIMRFIVGPGLMALSSIAFGIKGTLLKVAILQAALPQGIVPFVFAKEYDVHPDIMSTGVILGLLVAVPITLSYYFLMSL